MSEEIIQKLFTELRETRAHIARIDVAIRGDAQMNVDGLHQHMERLGQRIQVIEKDVGMLKSAKSKVVMWSTGFAAGMGVLGTKIYEWFKHS